MKKLFYVALSLLALVASASATVTVSTPTPGSTVASPTHYVATSTATTCATGVGAMGIYVNNKLIYTVNGAKLDTRITLAPGYEHTVVQEWDHCGGSTFTTINVTVVAAPTASIVANPASITSGSSSTLTVTATNATGVTVAGSDGSSFALSSTGGTLTVSPVATTTYTVHATGAGGTTTKTATVTVAAQGAPTVSITANPTSITSGSSSTLTVSATNATGVTVTGPDGTNTTLASTGGTLAVSPTATTIYTAHATGAGGTTTATATVTVNAQAAPAVNISANPTSITSGSSSTLTVTATNATGVTVTGSDGTSYTLTSTGGTQSVSPTATTTYTAHATGAGGTTTATAIVTVSAQAAPTVSITANPASITSGGSSTLAVTATNATGVTVSGSDGTSFTLSSTGGTKTVTPTATTTYTADATGSGTDATASATVTVGPAGSAQSINHVIFMLQENHTFDNYFGLLNPYRRSQNWNFGQDGHAYDVDGIDDKLITSNKDDEGVAMPLFKFKTTCIDDLTSSWLESYGDVNRYNFLTSRPILMDGFVHNAEGFAKSCAASGTCSGSFTDLTGQRAMGYYDEGLLNYYYYMASQFALSDRWFTPMSSKSIPNRIATFSGGTTQGLVFDPGSNDHLSGLTIPTIFQELDNAKVSWRIYYTTSSALPNTTFSYFTYAFQYLHKNTSTTPCTGTTQPSSVVGDSTNSFCIDISRIAPISTYFTDLGSGKLPSFSFIESGSGLNDEHPGSGQSILTGQSQVAKLVNALMTSPAWNDSVFFLGYDEGGGPYDHVPPVRGHSNDKTSAGLGSIPDISAIAVNPDAYNPCVPSGGTPTLHCDLGANSPGAHSGDAAAVNGFAAQLGFRVPNIVVSPFTRKHYVSHTPMDHTAIIKFVEQRFIGSSAHLTARDATQPDLLEFFDFSNAPWATPPTPPAPVTPTSLGHNPCTPTDMGP